MIIHHLDGGYDIHLPTSGGKAGRGCQKTTSLQVRQFGVILFSARFRVDDLDSRLNAVKDVKAFVNLHRHQISKGSFHGT